MTQKNINPLHKIYGTLKSTASKAAGKIAGNKTELTMRFYKEDFFGMLMLTAGLAQRTCCLW